MVKVRYQRESTCARLYEITAAHSQQRSSAAREDVEWWRLTTLSEKLAKIGAPIGRHGRHLVVPYAMFAEIAGSAKVGTGLDTSELLM